MISRLLTIIGLFCRISSVLKGYFAQESCNFKEPTNHCHPIPCNTMRVDGAALYIDIHMYFYHTYMYTSIRIYIIYIYVVRIVAHAVAARSCASSM